MRWVPEQGELSSSVHYHTADWPSLTLYIPPAAPGTARGGAPPSTPAAGARARLRGSRCGSRGPADSQLLKVCPAKGSRSNGDQSELGECPRSSVRSGRRAVRRGEERRERAGIQARELCAFSSSTCLFICQTFSSRSCLSTTCCLSVGV